MSTMHLWWPSIADDCKTKESNEILWYSESESIESNLICLLVQFMGALKIVVSDVNASVVDGTDVYQYLIFSLYL